MTRVAWQEGIYGCSPALVTKALLIVSTDQSTDIKHAPDIVYHQWYIESESQPSVKHLP